MVRIKQNKMVVDRTKKFNIERIENEIYSFLNQKSNQDGTYKGFNLTQEERERLRNGHGQMTPMGLDMETSVDEWFKQYTFEEMTTILETFRVIDGILSSFDTEHTWFIGRLIKIVRDIKLDDLLK